jgi:hypothetical protein
MVRQPHRVPTESERLREEVRRLEGELADLRAEAATRSELAPLVAAVLELQSADRDTLMGLGEMQERTARLELEALHRAFSVPPGARSDAPSKRNSEGAGRAIRREAVSTTAKLIVLGVVAFAAAAGYAVARAVGVPSELPPSMRATEVPGGP